MRSAVVIFPGSNCAMDISRALALATGKAPLHLWHDDTAPAQADLYVIPGGFSFGDYLRAGAMAARSRIMKSLISRAKQGAYFLGICNGFQILIEAGLLKGSLISNKRPRFICKTQQLEVASTNSPFTHHFQKGEQLTFPIAHQTGCYHASETLLDELQSNEQIAFRYHEDNPNGSSRNIAGIFDDSKRILGLMPHPERALYPFHASQDGARFFDNLFKM